MPFTASKIDAPTKAVIRVDASGLVFPVSTASFIIPIHCSTESGAAAAAGVGSTVAKPASRAIRNVDEIEKERFLTSMALTILSIDLNFVISRSPNAPKAIGGRIDDYSAGKEDRSLREVLGNP